VVDAARGKLEELLGRRVYYEDLLDAHRRAWEQVWQASDVVIEGDREAQRAVRYNLFQLLIAAPWHGERASIPAKTLSGFGYHGHIFWDADIFTLPLFTFTHPEVARQMLLYRYHTLPGARRRAAAGGFEGAQFPWESALTGDEVTPRWVPHAEQREPIRIWTGDIQLHINADVAYATWQYWQATGDDEFMARYGAEMILETALFWQSRVEWYPELERYEIHDVMGPDEYHERVNNNAFTNRMVQWHLKTALQLLDWLEAAHPQRAAELRRRLKLDAARLDRWRDIVAKIYIPYDAQTGLIEQFDGYFELRDVNLADYEPRDRSMQAILGIEGVRKTQIVKQPDVLMLLYLLGDAYDERVLRVNWDYYTPRTDHTYGSSLGPAIHAILACRLGDPEAAYEHFMRAALVDLEDTRGNAADGIHAASAGGVWQAVVFGFGGVRTADGGPRAKPRLPPGWRRLCFRLQYRGKWFEFDLRG
jgi:kojibiose phosphorylase